MVFSQNLTRAEIVDDQALTNFAIVVNIYSSLIRGSKKPYDRSTTKFIKT